MRIKAEETRQGGRGVEALTLRGVTRHAGVSATAAVPHFGTLTGLRSALAAQGYTEHAQRLLCALEGEIDGRERGVGSCLQSESRATSFAAGAAYIEFALDNPDLFRLMFRRALLDYTQFDLAIASDRAFQALRSLSGKDVAVPARPALMAGLWGRVHGLAVLAIDDMLGMFETEQGAEEG
ncbi:TetR-like C-terminal domain-containing protein [Asaia astilbis]|uniref:TetR-like C-terminal domain-containing protein n=1 Tax=Asaia astilbis TaxID=610244 RepID=UPI0018DB2DC2|nr:TetR-like C-terminal domain-containing protein [Asaia astilbis]